MKNNRNRMKRYWQLIGLLSVTVLVACGGNIKPKSEEVKVNEPAPPLEVPPDLFKPESDAAMAIPDIPKNTESKPALLNLENAQLRVERDGAIRWLVIQSSPDPVWRKIQSFWRDKDFEIRRQDAKLGIMETDWKVDSNTGIKAKTDNIVLHRDKYRVRIERGKQGETEIFVSHRGQYQTEQKGKLVWVPLAADINKEIEMIYQLMLYLGADKSRSANMIESEKDKNDQYHIGKVEGHQVLEIKGTIDHAWRIVGLAIDRSGIQIVRRDIDAANYVINVRQGKNNMEIVMNFNKQGPVVQVAAKRTDGKDLSDPLVKALLVEIKGNLS